jgi:aspartate ammonia-lyase
MRFMEPHRADESPGVAARTEHDLLGERQIPAAALHGIHTARALENFPLARRPVHPALARAYGTVKLAAALTNRALGSWDGDPGKAEAIERACRELSEGRLGEHIVVDQLQGGAGTSTNMNVNEVLANRALVILGSPPGAYDRVSPLEDLNLHQSTNDTYPTALKLAAIQLLKVLEQRVAALQDALQAAERRFAHVVKVGRTQLQDAVLTTLGREMSAYAEAMNRDRWRLSKCEERLRVINLGGTAIGTGLAAPRQFIFRVTDALREITGIGFARAENLIDATQNTDVFVEVSGLLKAHAVSLLKLCGDLRLMASGPEAGFGEIRLPARQVGSSLMPGKVNPVIPEAVTQVAMLVLGHDATIALACASGSLELNPFLPLVAACLLEDLDLLANADDLLRRLCVEGLEANEARCREHALNSTAAATALLPALGYEQVCRVVRQASESRRTIREVVTGAGNRSRPGPHLAPSLPMAEDEAGEAHAGGLLSPADFDALITPEAVCRLGSGRAATR